MRAMSRLLRCTCLAAVLFLAIGHANAQTWFGLRSGYPLGVTLHVGSQGALGGVADLRVSGRLETIHGNTRVGVALDALRHVGAPLPLLVYVGGGPAVAVGGGSAFLEVHGLVGAEYRFIDVGLTALGIFGELSLGAEIDTGTGRARLPTVGAGLGFNWHF